METKTAMKSETVGGLQDLIRINLDSADGFRKAAEKVDSAPVASLFRDLAAERSHFATELSSYVRLTGDEPTDDGSWKAKVHRWWIDLRSKVSDDELKVVLEEAERGEDKIKQAYETTLKEIAGNPVSDVLHRQYARVKKVHDRVRDARDTIKATS